MFIFSLFQDVSDIRRIKWGQKWLPRYFYQHIYVPMLYCAVSSVYFDLRGGCISQLYLQLGIKTRLQDFAILWNLRNSKSVLVCLVGSCVSVCASFAATIRMNRPFFNQYVIFFCGKLTHVVYRFVIPAMFVPWYTLVSAKDACMYT